MSPAVTLYTRRQCGLCDDALFALRELSSKLGFSIVERDIDDDNELRARYGEVIPVIAVGDTEIARAPIDPGTLRAALLSALRVEASP